MSNDNWQPKAGDVVTDHRGFGTKWCANLWTVECATASTMWLVGFSDASRKETVRKGKYGMGGGWGYVLATDDIVAAVRARRAWLASKPKTTAALLSRSWTGHSLETPEHLSVADDLRRRVDADALRRLATEAAALADWLAAEPKEP